MTVDWEDDAQVANQWFKWTVEIEVNGIWVRDGFELTEERLKEIVSQQLPFSYDNETRVRIVKSPDQKRIKESQGHPAT